MKKALTIMLASIMVLGACFAVGCKRQPRRDTGNIDVDYGKRLEDGGTIIDLKYEDDTPITFMYPSYFTRSSDEGDTFVAKGPDDNSVLMYEVGELSEARSYETIAAYTDAEAQDWMLKIQLGLVESQGVDSIELDDYRFLKLEDHLCLIVEATATYSTGLIQKNSLMNCILPDGTMYTLHAFAPMSAITKYGPLFYDVKYRGQDVTGALPVDDNGVVYADFDNGTIAFKYNDKFSITEESGVLFSMAPEHFGMLAYQPGELTGHTYDELKAMPNGELLQYLASLSAVAAGDADYVDSTEEDGHLRLEAHYTSDGTTKLNVVVTQFVFEDGSTRTLFAYMDEPEPVKDIRLVG